MTDKSRDCCWRCRTSDVLIPIAINVIDVAGNLALTQAAIEASLVRGGSLETAVQFAIRAAHVCVTRPGAQDSIPYKRELR
jgi:ribokinase